MGMRRKPNNPRQISKTEYARLQADLERFGDLGGIVHNATTDSLVGGNQRASVFDLVGKGAEIVITEEYDPPTRTGTTARGYVLWNGEQYDYRRVTWDEDIEDAACITANLRGGTWDFDIMVGFDAGLLADVGFDAGLLVSWNDQNANLALMLAAEKEAPPDDPGAQADKAEELQEQWQVKTGDIFQCGEHFVICGDCREPKTWARLLQAAGVDKANLLLTDPPYGIERDGGFEGFEGFGGFGTPIARRQYSDDWDSERPAQETFKTVLKFAHKSIIFGGNFFADILPRSTHWIVWDKMQTMPTFGDCELAWTNIDRKSVKKFTFQYNGLLGKEKERFHPTQKPTALFSAIITEYTKDGQCVVDPFLGSGTTIVAAHNEGRRGLGIERLEKYVAVTLQRLLDHTKIEPVRLG